MTLAMVNKRVVVETDEVVAVETIEIGDYRAIDVALRCGRTIRIEGMSAEQFFETLRQAGR